MTDILDNLSNLLAERKHADPDSSYAAKLYANGLNKILEKVGEESIETILAARDYEAHDSDENKQAVVSELADLIFHLMVMLGKLDIDHQNIFDELERRFGTSGLDEKAARKWDDCNYRVQLQPDELKPTNFWENNYGSWRN